MSGEKKGTGPRGGVSTGEGTEKKKTVAQTGRQQRPVMPVPVLIPVYVPSARIQRPVIQQTGMVGMAPRLGQPRNAGTPMVMPSAMRPRAMAGRTMMAHAGQRVPGTLPRRAPQAQAGDKTASSLSKPSNPVQVQMMVALRARPRVATLAGVTVEETMALNRMNSSRRDSTSSTMGDAKKKCMTSTSMASTASVATNPMLTATVSTRMQARPVRRTVMMTTGVAPMMTRRVAARPMAVNLKPSLISEAQFDTMIAAEQRVKAQEVKDRVQPTVSVEQKKTIVTTKVKITPPAEMLSGSGSIDKDKADEKTDVTAAEEIDVKMKEEVKSDEKQVSFCSNDTSVATSSSVGEHNTSPSAGDVADTKTDETVTGNSTEDEAIAELKRSITPERRRSKRKAALKSKLAIKEICTRGRRSNSNAGKGKVYKGRSKAGSVELSSGSSADGQGRGGKRSVKSASPVKRTGGRGGRRRTPVLKLKRPKRAKAVKLISSSDDGSMSDEMPTVRNLSRTSRKPRKGKKSTQSSTSSSSSSLSSSVEPKKKRGRRGRKKKETSVGALPVKSSKSKRVTKKKESMNSSSNEGKSKKKRGDKKKKNVESVTKRPEGRQSRKRRKKTELLESSSDEEYRINESENDESSSCEEVGVKLRRKTRAPKRKLELIDESSDESDMVSSSSSEDLESLALASMSGVRMTRSYVASLRAKRKAEKRANKRRKLNGEKCEQYDSSKKEGEFGDSAKKKKCSVTTVKVNEIVGQSDVEKKIDNGSDGDVEMKSSSSGTTGRRRRKTKFTLKGRRKSARLKEKQKRLIEEQRKREEEMLVERQEKERSPMDSTSEAVMGQSTPNDDSNEEEEKNVEKKKRGGRGRGRRGSSPSKSVRKSGSSKSPSKKKKKKKSEKRKKKQKKSDQKKEESKVISDVEMEDKDENVLANSLDSKGKKDEQALDEGVALMMDAMSLSVPPPSLEHGSWAQMKADMTTRPALSAPAPETASSSCGRSKIRLPPLRFNLPKQMSCSSSKEPIHVTKIPNEPSAMNEPIGTLLQRLDKSVKLATITGFTPTKESVLSASLASLANPSATRSSSPESPFPIGSAFASTGLTSSGGSSLSSTMGSSPMQATTLEFPDLSMMSSSVMQYNPQMRSPSEVAAMLAKNMPVFESKKERMEREEAAAKKSGRMILYDKLIGLDRCVCEERRDYEMHGFFETRYCGHGVGCPDFEKQREVLQEIVKLLPKPTALCVMRQKRLQRGRPMNEMDDHEELFDTVYQDRKRRDIDRKRYEHLGGTLLTEEDTLNEYYTRCRKNLYGCPKWYRHRQRNVKYGLRLEYTVFSGDENDESESESENDGELFAAEEDIDMSSNSMSVGKQQLKKPKIKKKKIRKKRLLKLSKRSEDLITPEYGRPISSASDKSESTTTKMTAEQFEAFKKRSHIEMNGGCDLLDISRNLVSYSERRRKSKEGVIDLSIERPFSRIFKGKVNREMKDGFGENLWDCNDFIDYNVIKNGDYIRKWHLKQIATSRVPTDIQRLVNHSQRDVQNDCNKRLGKLGEPARMISREQKREFQRSFKYSRESMVPTSMVSDCSKRRYRTRSAVQRERERDVSVCPVVFDFDKKELEECGIYYDKISKQYKDGNSVSVSSCDDLELKEINRCLTRSSLLMSPGGLMLPRFDTTTTTTTTTAAAMESEMTSAAGTVPFVTMHSSSTMSTSAMATTTTTTTATSAMMSGDSGSGLTSMDLPNSMSFLPPMPKFDESLISSKIGSMGLSTGGTPAFSKPKKKADSVGNSKESSPSKRKRKRKKAEQELEGELCDESAEYVPLKRQKRSSRKGSKKRGKSTTS